MAAQRNIFDRVIEIDDTKPKEWALRLESGYEIFFPPSVSHKKFENGDEVLIGFENWGEANGFAHLCLFRDKRLVTHFIFGDGCRIESPDDEIIYDGKLITVVLNGENDLTVTHKADEEVGVIIYPGANPKKTTMLVGPSSYSAIMVLGDSEEGPKIRVIKED